MTGLNTTRIFEAARLVALAFFCLAATSSAALAQDSDVKKYAIDVKFEPAAHAADIRATFSLWNPTDAPKRQAQFRILGGADIRSVMAGGQAATFDARDDRRFTGLKSVSIQLPSAIPGKGTVDITVNYRLTLGSNALDATIARGESMLLPSSLWFPMVNTPFIQYGPSTAPYSLTATAAEGDRAVSGGTLSGTTYTQTLSSLPFVITGRFEAPVTETASGIQFECLLPQNASAPMRAGAGRLLKEAAAISEFYTRTLGPAPQVTFRIVTSDISAGFSSSSGVSIGRKVLLRDFTDAETFDLLADSIARVWIESAAVRGATPGSGADKPQGVAIVRDVLARYLSVLATGDRFGPQAEAESYRRLAAGLLAMGDLADQVQLSLATPFDPAFRGLVVTKGPLTMRIFEREIGRDKLLGAIRTTLSGARTSGVLTAENFRAELNKAAGRDLAALYATWFDTVSQVDLIVGVPVQNGPVWTSALRNLGTGNVSVDVVATTVSGKKITTRATVASEGFGQVQFETSEKIDRVEIDPERVIPQKNYSNDARPARPAAESLFVEGVGLVKRKEFAPAEQVLRQALAAHPADAVTKAWLARAVLGQGKSADAEKLANEALAQQPVPVEAASWSNIVLGQVALAASNTKTAAEHFTRAGNTTSETSAIKAAREGLMATERAAGQNAGPDASVVKFFADFDRAVSAGVNTVQAEQLVDSAALPDFIKGLVTSVSRKWVTEVLRTEQISSNEFLVDTRYSITAPNRSEQAVTLTRLRRDGSQLRIVDVQILDSTDNTAEPQ